MNIGVLFTLTGDIRYNSRALKQLQLLANEGYSVAALGIGASTGEEQLFERVLCKTLPRPQGRGPAFFGRVHRLFSEHLPNYSARTYHASDLYSLPAQSRQAARQSGALVYDARERYPFVASTAGRPLDFVVLGDGREAVYTADRCGIHREQEHRLSHGRFLWHRIPDSAP